MAGILILRPRFGKYAADGKIRPIPGHNLSLATIGAFVLRLDRFGFNPGSTMAADPVAIAHVLMTTNTAAIAATLSATAISWLLLGKPDLRMTINGCLAGLVAITAPCAFVSLPSALIIGIIAGILVVLAVIGFDRSKIDDPVGALSVHLVNVIFGTLAVGLFAQDSIAGVATGNGLFFGGFKLLGAQLAGVLTTAVFVFLGTFVVWIVLKATIGIRVSLQEEIEDHYRKRPYRRDRGRQDFYLQY